MELSKLKALTEATTSTAPHTEELQRLQKAIKEAVKIASSKKIMDAMAEIDKKVPGMDAKSTLFVVKAELARHAKKIENLEADIEANL